MTEALLAGIRVVDLAGEPAAMAGRILADLGADVVLVEPPGGHPLRALPAPLPRVERGQGEVDRRRAPTTRSSTSSSPRPTS